MTMDWDNYLEVAQALDKRYPDADRMNLSAEELVPMITALSDFTGETTPPDDEAVNDILMAWINLDGEANTGSWDADV